VESLPQMPPVMVDEHCVLGPLRLHLRGATVDEQLDTCDVACIV
jgi:hypothetical protein